VQEPLLIYTSQLSSRLDYICKFFFRDVLQIPFVFTTSIAKVSNADAVFINYSHQQLPNGLQIIPHTLLQNSSIEPQQICIDSWLDLPTFFTTNGSFIPFDIFSAGFYLISRYEEYLPYKEDEYQRFAHTNSCAHTHNFLHLPLVDMWVHQMYAMLLSNDTTLQPSSKQFAYLPTYDIDMISAYQYKDWGKNILSICKDISKGFFAKVTERINVLFGKQTDPFDCFAQLLSATEVHAIYFILCAQTNSTYDKNLPPSSVAMQSVIKNIVSKFDVGIHPSYNSHQQSNLLLQEINALQTITNSKVTESRQHFIKYTLPNTYQQLIAHGIEIDYSMGYGSINGFRASTCTPFSWFNVSTNKITNLQIVPFCWMDANCIYEQKMNATEALENWQYYLQICKQYNGLFVDIWHNFIIGNGDYNKQWMAIWQQAKKIATT
jgi:hypothetical protein